MSVDSIRVGLVRMDTHSIYMGVLMQEHDPMLLRGPMPCADGSFKHGWQAGGAYLYFYTIYRAPTTITVPPVEGFELVRVWDEDRELAELASSLFCSKPKVCESIDQVSDDVDVVVIGDCKSEGQDHVALARPGIEKGVPTYIDKPFAFNLEDARHMADLARRGGVPVLSLSILREAPGLSHFRDRLDEVAPLNLGVIFGCAGLRMDGLIHAISAAQHVFGGGVRSVQCMGETVDIIQLGYGDAPNRPSGGVILTKHAGGGDETPFGFYATAIGKHGAIQSQPENDHTHPYGMRRIVEKIRTMVMTGRSPTPMREMLENIAVADAVRAAHASGRRTHVVNVELDQSP